MEFVSRNVVFRIVKPYPEARNHVYLGKVTAYDGKIVEIDGRVLHFGRPSVDDPTGGLTTSERATRWVSLQRLEYIRGLPDGMDPFDPEHLKVAQDGSLVYLAAQRPDLLPD